MKSSQSRSAGSGYFPAVSFALPAAALLLLASPAPMQAGNGKRSPEVPAAIQVPGGTNKVHFHAYAVGVQIYVWTVNPTNAALSSWVFKAPEAVLFADAGAHGETGIHYAGPTWESQSGSKVVGTAIANAPSPNANSIPLLLIRAVSTERPGIFEEAHTGTLFLDEIGELSMRAQAKVLRVIQEGELKRVGENIPRRVDVRIVAATNRDLRSEAAASRFRMDLLYRLDVVRIVMPALRDRREDIAPLAEHFWREAAERVGSRATLGATTIASLARYDWPGNVRELQNVLAALAVRTPKRGVVPPSALPPSFTGAVPSTAKALISVIFIAWNGLGRAAPPSL